VFRVDIHLVTQCHDKRRYDECRRAQCRGAVFHRRLKSAGKEPVAAHLPRLPCSAGPLLFIDWLAVGSSGRLSRARGVGGKGVGGVGGQSVGGSGRKLFAFGGNLVVQRVESLGFGAVKVEPPVAYEVVLASML